MLFWGSVISNYDIPRNRILIIRAPTLFLSCRAGSFGFMEKRIGICRPSVL